MVEGPLENWFEIEGDEALDARRAVQLTNIILQDHVYLLNPTIFS